MKAFNYANCNINLVIRIKKAFKQAANNPTARSAFLSLLADTSSATENIFECVQNPTEMEKRLELIHTGDVSFADDLLGLSPSGDNNSRYRAYLALDNNNIIQIRIGNHYETKKALLDKANNKAQFVFQIVMVTTPPKPEAEDAVTNSTKIGNLRVLTDKIMSSDSTIDDLKNVLYSINDYLISPTTSYENATQLTESNTYKNIKNTIKLNEQQLRNVIAESIKNVLNEGQWDAIDAAYDFMWGEGSDERFDNSNGIKAYFKRPITLKWEVLFEKPDGKRYTQEVSSNVQYKLFMSRNTFMNLAKEKLKKQLSCFGEEYGKPISARTTSLYDNLGILKLGPNEIGGNINY